MSYVAQTPEEIRGLIAKAKRWDVIFVVLGIVAGGIPAVLLAALVVKSLPLDALRWGVVAVVTYSAVMLLRTAVRTPRQPHAAVASKSSRSPDP